MPALSCRHYLSQNRLKPLYCKVRTGLYKYTGNVCEVAEFCVQVTICQHIGVVSNHSRTCMYRVLDTVYNNYFLCLHYRLKSCTMFAV